jgi:DNA (cytosine-5)-methyltransferase 1
MSSIGSLFSGCGGLDLGVMSVLGGYVAWHVENDPHAAKVLKARSPGVPNLGDITAIDWTQVEPVDVLTAGFPCQDLSYAGRGAGITEGTRSGLWFEVVRAIGVLRPRLVVLENVAAIVGRRPGLDVVLGSLATFGFDADWCCVRASDVGAPHKRERWFAVAYPHGQRHERAGCSRGRWGGSADDRVAVAGADCGELQRLGVDQVLASSQGAEPREELQRQRDGHAAVDRRAAAADTDRDGRAQLGWEHAGGCDADRRGSEDVAWGVYEPAIRRWESIVGRAAPAPTVAGRNGPRLNPRLPEWMMGLPDGWVTDILDRNPALKCLGNGVVPQQCALAVRLLLDVEAAA